MAPFVPTLCGWGWMSLHQVRCAGGMVPSPGMCSRSGRSREQRFGKLPRCRISASNPPPWHRIWRACCACETCRHGSRCSTPDQPGCRRHHRSALEPSPRSRESRSDTLCGKRSPTADRPGWAGRRPAECGSVCVPARARHGRQQRAACKDAAGRRTRCATGPVSIDPAEIHHGDPIAQAAHHRQIVADEQHRKAKPRAQIGEQRQHLRLHRDVERGDRFVGHQEIRLPWPARAQCRCAGAGRRRIRADSGRRACAGRPTCGQQRLAPARAVRPAGRCRGSPGHRQSARRRCGADRGSNADPGTRSACAGATGVAVSAPAVARSMPSNSTRPVVGVQQTQQHAAERGLPGAAFADQRRPFLRARLTATHR